jgi:hypothetical protein
MTDDKKEEEKPVEIIIRSIPIAISPINSEFIDNMPYDIRNELYEYISSMIENILLYMIKNGGFPS